MLFGRWDTSQNFDRSLKEKEPDGLRPQAKTEILSSMARMSMGQSDGFVTEPLDKEFSPYALDLKWLSLSSSGRTGGIFFEYFVPPMVIYVMLLAVDGTRKSINKTVIAAALNERTAYVSSRQSPAGPAPPGSPKPPEATVADRPIPGGETPPPDQDLGGQRSNA